MIWTFCPFKAKSVLIDSKTTVTPAKAGAQLIGIEPTIKSGIPAFAGMTKFWSGSVKTNKALISGTMTNVKRLFILAICLGLTPCGLGATTADETETSLNNVRETLAKSNAKISEITAALTEAQKAESDISLRLVLVGQNIQAQKSALDAAEEKISSLQLKSLTLQSDLSARQNELSALLSGLMHLKANPPPAIVVAPDDALEAIRGAMVFGAVVPEVEARRKSLKMKLEELETLREATANEKQKQQDSLISLGASEQELKSLQDQKHKFTELAHRDLTAEKENVAALASKASTLSQLLSGLRKAKEVEDKRLEVQALAAAKAEAARLEALRAPPKLLSSMKAQLAYPVIGTVIKAYGEQTSLGTKLEGVALSTAPQAIVNAPIDGKVEFAGSFRSYGQLLILDAGAGYLVLLAGMSKISAEIGQNVRLGEPVGAMGDGPSTLTLLGDAKTGANPIFYVEFRKDNAPVDSTPWWLDGRKEAMK